MMIKSISLITILLISFNTYAKEIKILGQVTDSISNNPLPLSTLQVSDPEQNIIFTGIVREDDARFTFENIKLENRQYTIIISYLGYAKKVIPINGKQANKTLNLGIIRMIPLAQTMEEVTVTAEAPMIRQAVDRIVYRIDSARLAGVSVTTDLLRGIPEIAVDELQRRAKIKGKENTLILLNGVNTGLSVDLRSIDFRDIERVEVITAPSSGTEVEYDGIINIILKPKVRNGVMVDFEETLKADLHSNDSYLGLTWGSNKIRTKFTYDNYYRANPYDINQLRTDKVVGNSYGTDGHCHKPLEVSNNIGLNLDYYISPKDFFNITTRTSLIRADKGVQYTPYTLDDNIRNDLSGFHTRFRNDYVIGNYTLFYRRTFAKASNYLSVNTNIGFMNATEDVNTKYEDGTTFFNHELGDKFNSTLRIEYNNQISKLFRINVGTQGYFQDFKGSLNAQPNENNFKNYRYNAYADLFFTVNAFQFRVGLKGEVNTNDFKDSAYGSNTQRSLQPIAVALVRFYDHHWLKLAYRRFSYYPSAWMLAPYEIRNDEKTVSKGNPDLELSLSDHIELTYSLRTKAITLDAALYYLNRDKMIASMQYYDPDLNSTIIPQNAGKSDRIGFRLNGSLNFLGGAISIDPEANFFYEKMTLGAETRHQYTPTFGGTLMLALPLGFGCGGYGSYTGKLLTIQGYQKARYAIDAVFIMKRFDKIGLNLFAGYQSILQSADVDYTLTGNYQQRDYFKFDSKGLIFRLNYYFTTGKQVKMERVNTYFDTDKK